MGRVWDASPFSTGWTAPFVSLDLFGVVGCELRGPPVGVASRGTSGGESGGAGMEVPSVREKLTGSIDSGSNRLGIVVQYRGSCRRGFQDGGRKDESPARSRNGCKRR